MIRKVLLNLQARFEQSGAMITWDGHPDRSRARDPAGAACCKTWSATRSNTGVPSRPRIHISAQRGNGDWLFSVQDNGIGIEPEYAQQIFGIFKRLHGQDLSRNRHRPGDLSAHRGDAMAAGSGWSPTAKARASVSRCRRPRTRLRLRWSARLPKRRAQRISGPSHPLGSIGRRHECRRGTLKRAPHLARILVLLKSAR